MDMEMSGKERISNILKRKPVDRIGLFEHFWGDTQKVWTEHGYIKKDEDLAAHFGFDMSTIWAFNYVANLDYKNEVIEEDTETKLEKDGNYAILRRHKLHNATPEHVDFTVKDRVGWEELIKPFLIKTDRRRINFEGYKSAKEAAAKANRFFCWSGVNVFEQMHPICGHEYMLMGMALDPYWIKDMTDTLSDLNLRHMEILFTECGKPDGIWFYEDMGFKERPFMSPEMYREMIQPPHKKTFDYAHSLGLPVLVHACGFVEPLVPGLIEAGMDCLQAIEVKAGMDLISLKKNFGHKIALCGGMDARNLVANDRDAIRKELEEKISVVKAGSGYILHSDHSIPADCKYETYRYFVDEGLRLGKS
ncbi:MAG: uroporphyrinogen decarboxylase family protein [Victivallales bacterium]